MPEKGLYYHYKHDPSISINDHAHELVGVALHTETRELTVVYKPLYANSFLGEADFCSRPLEMFLETVEKDGVVMNRFTKITDPEIIRRLEEIDSR